MNPSTIIMPSILSAPFDQLAQSIQSLETQDMRLLHFDVMDGHFVPNITIGPLIIQSLEPIIQSQFDVHLMVTNPEVQYQWFHFNSVRSITFHIEVHQNITELSEKIRNSGKRSGISLNPNTNINCLEPFLGEIDQILVMSVHPGFGGQEFIPDSLKKIEYLANKKSKEKFQFTIQVDGGINEKNVTTVVNAGAEEVIAGNSIFGSRNPVQSYLQLIQLIPL